MSLGALFPIRSPMSASIWQLNLLQIWPLLYVLLHGMCSWATGISTSINFRQWNKAAVLQTAHFQTCQHLGCYWLLLSYSFQHNGSSLTCGIQLLPLCIRAECSGAAWIEKDIRLNDYVGVMKLWSYELWTVCNVCHRPQYALASFSKETKALPSDIFSVFCVFSSLFWICRTVGCSCWHTPQECCEWCDGSKAASLASDTSATFCGLKRVYAWRAFLSSALMVVQLRAFSK